MTMDALLQDVLADLAGPTLLIGHNRRVLFANDAFRQLAQLEVQDQLCSVFLAPTIPLAESACCWSVADRYLACDEAALWHVRTGSGACRLVLGTLRDIRVGKRSSVIALSLQALPDGGAVQELAKQHFTAMRQSLGEERAFASWVERYLRRQLGIRQLGWLTWNESGTLSTSAPLWRAVAHAIVRAIDAHPAAVRESGAFDIVVEPSRARPIVVHVFAPVAGSRGPLLAVSGTQGRLDGSAVAMLRAAVDAASEARTASGSPATLHVESLALSRVEREVLELTCSGRTDKEIARHRSVSVNTVRNQVRSLMLKLGVNKRTQLVARILQAQHDLA